MPFDEMQKMRRFSRHWSDKPALLRPHLEQRAPATTSTVAAVPKRQARHLIAHAS
jgi:hypothetical protein